ncbi:hypothetical protein BCR35DRAFT_35692 [Leucosporidium creatinivorum]|uniref:ZNF598/HEL2 PAH domain-containing protein n=1 Tax=Leucosporidium creatinivorum TaxID=106004 RepID=A0A1Y2CB61_9BASI|nr:hypothetical protein BCR35DRAFT_35692 [Leucosporidium creatinivorum]
MRRVKQAVNGSEAKVTSFKLSVRAYRANELSSDDLIDQLWNIFDQNLDLAGPIIEGLADLFVQEDPEKRTSLLSAWEGLRAEQNQFPTLAPLAPALNGIPTNSTSTSSRGLNNRNSRNQRGGGTPAVWDRVAQAAAAPPPRANPFPSLASNSNSNVVGLRPKARATPWAGSSSSAPSSAPPSRGSSPLPSSRPTPISLPPPPAHQHPPSALPPLNQVTLSPRCRVLVLRLRGGRGLRRR